MDSINTMLIIDLVIIVVGIYFFYLGIKMKRTRKVDSFVVPEETLKNCKNMEAFAYSLSQNQIYCSIMMIGSGILMAMHETVYSLGKGYYVIVAILVLSIILYYKGLTDLKTRFC